MAAGPASRGRLGGPARARPDTREPPLAARGSPLAAGYRFRAGEGRRDARAPAAANRWGWGLLRHYLNWSHRPNALIDLFAIL